jgi:hypothetical protein
MTTSNQYTEPNAIEKFIVLANQTQAVILANPHQCRMFVANDTGNLIVFDKDLNPLIFSAGVASPGYIPPYAAAPAAIATYHQMWYDTVNNCYKITASIGTGGATKQVLITDPE